MEYLEHLYEKFKNCKFEIVNFDNGCTPQSMQCYLLVSNLDKCHLKDKGTTALDLGNYIYNRYGFVYEHPPEYARGEEQKNTIAFYQSKEKFESDHNKHIREWILKHDLKSKRPESIIFFKNRIEIPNVPPYKEFIAIWKKTNEIVIIRKGRFTEVIFEAAKKEFRYLQAELGPESDFKIIDEL